MLRISRRHLLLSGIAAAAYPVIPADAAVEETVIHVRKDPDCSCCSAWIKIVETAGFPVTVEMLPPADLAAFKVARGIPQAMASCHTAEAGGYLIEGHVPVADLRRLLAEMPDALGLAVPGMPWGSPGMGPEAEREAYDVHLIARDGSTTLFSSYPAA